MFFSPPGFCFSVSSTARGNHDAAVFGYAYHWTSTVTFVLCCVAVPDLSWTPRNTDSLCILLTMHGSISKIWTCLSWLCFCQSAHESWGFNPCSSVIWAFIVAPSMFITTSSFVMRTLLFFERLYDASDVTLQASIINSGASLKQQSPSECPKSLSSSSRKTKRNTTPSNVPKAAKPLNANLRDHQRSPSKQSEENHAEFQLFLRDENTLLYFPPSVSSFLSRRPLERYFPPSTTTNVPTSESRSTEKITSRSFLSSFQISLTNRHGLRLLTL